MVLSASTARLKCANLGHKWEEDVPTFQEKASPRLGIKYVWVLTIHCERNGCTRTRRDVCMPKTYQLITRSYGGKIERIGRVTREELREELIRRGQ